MKISDAVKLMQTNFITGTDSQMKCYENSKWCWVLLVLVIVSRTRSHVVTAYNPCAEVECRMWDSNFSKKKKKKGNSNFLSIFGFSMKNVFR